MKEVRGLIYFAGVSRSVPSIRGFKRCPAHGNVLAYDGRPLPMDEFNRVADKVLGEQAKGIYGLIPVVRLVEVEVAESVAAPVPPEAPPAPRKPVVPLPDTVRVSIVPADGIGYMLVDYESDPCRYMGTAQVWESDVSLITTFATEEEARQAAPGPIVPAPEISTAPAMEPLVEAEAPVADAGATAPESSDSAAAKPKKTKKK